MTRKRRFNFIGIVAGVLLLTLLAGAPPVLSLQQVWVSAFHAKLKAHKTASSKTLAVLKVGTALSVKGKEGRWYRVTAPGGVTGWIYRGKVASEPPRTDDTRDGDSVGKLLTGLTGSRIGPGNVDTSRSMRMLSVEKKKKKGAQSGEIYEKALESVLSRRISDVQLERFLAAGKIGEYAP